MADWHALFDAFEAERIAGMVREDESCQQLSDYIPSLHKPLRDITLASIDEYIIARGGLTPGGKLNLNRADIDAAYRLYMFIAGLAERVADRAIRGDDAAELERLWLLFIAQGAGYRIYHDLPAEEAARERRRQTNRDNASRPRTRKPALWLRGFQCALDENPNLTAELLRDWLDGLPRTYDYEDLELRLDGTDVVIRDLETGETATVPKRNQREYLKRARNS